MIRSIKPSFRIVLLLVLLATVKPAVARIIYVDPATGQNTNGFADGWGLSWAKPCKDLMHAIYWSAQGDEIWLNEGTYYPCQPQNGLGTPNADRSLSFFPKKNTRIYGGFSKGAGATDMGSRNPAVYISKLSGEIQQDNNSTNNSRRIMSTYLLEGFSVLDGVTITGAYTEEGTSGSAYANFGGGLYLNNVSPTINNCIFLSNTATQGGGVFCENSSPTFNNCKFLGNWVQYAPTFIVVYASHGGAVYNKFGTPVYNNCLFNDNVAKWSNQSDVSGTGFAVYYEKSNAQFINCEFTNNFSIGYSFVRRPAAVMNVGGAPAYISCLFQGNGGRGMSSVEGCEDLIRACAFIGNSGGLQIDQSGTRIYNCQFSGNGLPKDGVGGAISISDTKERQPMVSNCLINNNVAERGAGIYAYYTSAKINNCTITGNQAGPQGGGGVYNIGRGYKLALPPGNNIFPSSMVSNPLEYFNCIVYGNNGGNNTPFDSLTKNFFTDVTPVFVYSYPFGTTIETRDFRPQVHNSIIGTTNNVEFTTKMAFDKGGNYLNANPKFVAPASGNYTLTICSPAINTGNNAFIPANSPTYSLDLNNQGRFYEGITDIGCYELQQPFGGTITNTTQYICQGQTATIFGQPQTVGGVYTNSTPLPNGCTATTQITLVVRPLPKGVVTLSDNCFNTGTINIKPTVGTAPFSIKLNNVTSNNIAADSSAIFPGLSAGTYKYYITDANGCSDSADAVLTTNAFPSSVIYVDSAAVGSNTGTNWANAFTSLQSALSRANCAGITQIWVAKGTYYPSTNVAGVAVSNTSACFRMLNGIAIYGGFDRATGDTTLATRNWKKNPVVLSGDIQQDGVIANNVYNVVNNFGNGLNTTAVLDGFTITGAYNTFDFGSGVTYGGGMTNNGSSPTIRNCTFENNRVNGATQSFGGAIYNYNCAPVISNCKFIFNTVSASFYALGGAIYNDLSSPSISYCEFSANQTLNATNAYGAGIANASGAPITISNCLFTSNNGGAIASYNNTMTLKNSTIYSNTAPVGIGGGLFNYGGGNPTVSNCIIVGNSNGNITSESGTITINHSDIATSGGSGAGWNTALGVDAGGNIDVNPQFTADLHLSPCSPAKDAGSNVGVSGLDLDNNPRIVGATVDMGCYEYQTSLTIYGSIVYVDVNATGLKNGTSWANAFTDLSDALKLTVCTGVNTIYVSKGTYYTSVSAAYGLPADYQEPTFAVRNGVSILGGFSVADGVTTLAARNYTLYKTMLSGDVNRDGILENNCRAVVTITGNASVVDGFTIQDGFNNTTGNGAGMYIVGFSPTINNCTFTANSINTPTGQGAGVYVNGGSPVFNNCKFYANKITSSTSGFGAGAYNVSAGSIFNDCAFKANNIAASGNAFGAGMCNFSNGTISVNRCKFETNTLSAANPAGGGIYTTVSSPMVVDNCLFNSNIGGALCTDNSGLALTNTTIVNNITNQAEFSGGYLCINSSPTITNCIFYNNNNGNIINYASTPLIKNSLIQGSGGSSAWNVAIGTDGGGNKDQSPLFTSDFHLNICSPAVDAGSNTGVSALDLDKNPRISNAVVDMGCYESNYNTAVYGNRIYVDSAAAGSNDGTSWANAFKDMQTALSLAKCLPITEIYVSKGTYFPSASTAGDINNNQFSCFVMKNNLSIVGGFSTANGITTLTARNPKLYPAVLSAEIQKDGEPLNNAYNIINNYNINLDTTAVLDGFTLSGVYNTFNWGGGITNAGAVINVNASPKFVNCVFADNKIAAIAEGYGAAMYNVNAAPVIRNCSFVRNGITASTKAYGGAIYNSNSNPLIANCMFDNNTLTGPFLSTGSAVYALGGTPAAISNSLFTNNNASAICLDGNNANITNTTVTTAATAVALYNVGATPVISNSIFFGTSGTAISNASTTPLIRHSLIQGSGGSASWNSAFGIDGGNNKDADPIFTGDYHLTPCVSPAINAGNNAYATGALDLDNKPRIRSSSVDMGCYESAYTNAAYGPTIYVNATATGHADGTDWANAFTDLQDALTLAKNSCGAGITAIYVSKGTYYPTTAANGIIANNPFACFQMKNNLTIIGGFSVADGITSLAARNAALYPTILSGDMQQDNIPGNNVYNVINNFNTNLDTTAVLDGFTLTGAMNNITGIGGAVINSNASPKFLNCIFSDNFVGGTTIARGAGMHNANSAPIIRNCTFMNNTANGINNAFGAGLSNDNATPKIESCIFKNNTVNAPNPAGGGMYSNGGGGHIANSLFTGNSGTAICADASVFTLYNNTITNNTGTPALGRAGGLLLISSNFNILNSVVYGNPDGSITNQSSTPTFYYCDVEGSGAPTNWNNAFGINGGGNTDVNPLFTANFHLQPCSPLINMGDAAAAFGSTDLDNTARVKKAALDPGCYESDYLNTASGYTSILYVDAAATGVKNGSSWANAFADMQQALELAKYSCVPVTAIYVSKGTYYPTTAANGVIANNPFACFQMKNNLSIIGGFSVADGVTSLAARNAALYPTILSGDIQQDNIPGNNAYNVINNFNTNLDTTAVLDGFTVTGAMNNITGIGGAVINANSSPKFLNCIFTDNFVGGTTTARGAGMHNNNGSPIIRNCTFMNNTANGINNAFGAGLSNDNAIPKIESCIFKNNTVNAPNPAGGGMYSNGGGGGISNSLFTGNSGTAICADASVFTLYNNTITNNTGTPALGRAGGLLLFSSNFNILNSVVYGNTNGSITNISTTPTFFYCDVEGSGAPSDWNNAYGINGGGNKDVNPLFTVDYQLANCSPLLDAGDNASIFGALDIANKPRIANGTVDMGCYERQTGACTLCPGEATYFAAGLSGSSYQWQVNTGSGYSNIGNGGIYSGANSPTLAITGAATNMRGTKYRCVVNGGSTGPEQVLKYAVRWNGSASTAWNNPANWDCGVLPDAFTDVVVPVVSNYPLVNSHATCFSLLLQPGSTVTVAPGIALLITGK